MCNHCLGSRLTSAPNGITYFTNLIYTSICHAVGAGDVAPFVGHNAFLRWRAIQSIAFEQDNQTKFWSEEHVSEDFDVALRLQIEGFIVRLAAYHQGAFKEGVSLTVYDELARWEKYAFGCNELLFHPLKDWPTKGIFTPLIKRFLCSNIKVSPGADHEDLKLTASRAHIEVHYLGSKLYPS